jgi:hypothetical protein
MTIATARDAIVRKFTNYRNTYRRNQEERITVTDRELLDTMKLAASALVDLKTFSKGRSLFKRRKHSDILKERDVIMLDDPNMSQVGAYQKALKLLWNDADQDIWEAQAQGEAEDVFEYIFIHIVYNNSDYSTTHRNQKIFPPHLFSSLRALCHVGGLGKLEVVAFYAFRDGLDRIETGM